jgi:hypothetical protein
LVFSVISREEMPSVFKESLHELTDQKTHPRNNVSARAGNDLPEHAGKRRMPGEEAYGAGSLPEYHH